MSVVVVTDSAATVPAELAARLGIVVVPLRINLGGESLLDGEVAPEVLLERTEEVTTSGPTPADFLAAIEDHAGSEGVLIATVSHAMGAGTYLAAKTALAAAKVPARLVDTETAAGGQGLVVVAAAEAAQRGASLEAVEATARDVLARVRLVATFPNLDHLVGSGHVPEAPAWAARGLGLNPVIELKRGKVTPLAPALNAERARRRIVDVWRRSRPSVPTRLHVAALHSLAEEAAGQLLAAVCEETPPHTAFVGPFGTGMLVHSGPGVVGLAWWWQVL